jgi:hypothetical protein
LALAASTPELMPGWMIRPSAMPISTAMKAVNANQSSVCQTSAAALESWRRLLIEATIAVKISGGTSACSNCTKIEPVVANVVVRAFGWPAASGPILRAIQPSTSPITMAARTWKPKFA